MSCKSDEEFAKNESENNYCSLDIIECIEKGHCEWFENWDIKQDSIKTKYISEYYYWGYFIRDLGLIYHFNHDEKAKRIAREVLNILQEKCTYQNVITCEVNHNWFRDDFARNQRLLFEAYQYFGERTYLEVIEKQVLLWFDKVPRSYHNAFKIFPYGIKFNGETFESAIDPNQNLILAWLFSELYFCRESSFYKSSKLKEIIMNEVDATLSLQLPTGELPLAETYPLVFDSNYGGYSSGILYNICHYWNIPKWNKALCKMGEWLYSAFPMSHPWNVKEDFPNYVKDRFYASNLLERIPAFYAAGIPEEYVHAWVDFVVTMFPETDKLIPIKFYQKRTLPSSYLVKGYGKEIGYDVPLVIEKEGKIMIIWREVTEVRIGKDVYREFPVSLSEVDDIVIVDIFGRSFNYQKENEDSKIIDVIDYKRPLIKKK